MPYTITREDAERDLRALRSLLSGFPVSVSSSSVPALLEIINAIEDQVKPAVEEPEAFGSIVRARYPGNQTDSCLWQMAPEGRGRHYWESEYGAVEVWSELTDVEVLRVGLGEQSADVEKLREEAWDEGARELAAQISTRLQNLLADAITGERKNAFEKAIQAVEELAP